MTIFYSDVKPLSKYSHVTLHLPPATWILSENPDAYERLYGVLVTQEFDVLARSFCSFFFF